MSDWGSYALADLVYVSPAAWARLYERFHAALWPAQWAAGLAGLALLLLAWRATARPAALALAALGWASVAAIFHWHWHAELNWAAPWIAAGWAVQALLLAGAALKSGDWAPAGPRRSAGLALMVLALLAAPLLPRTEVFGLTPDATALATLGLLLALRPAPVWLWPLPLLALAQALLLAWAR
jgi:Family of unknown function (DUF6064)